MIFWRILKYHSRYLSQIPLVTVLFPILIAVWLSEGSGWLFELVLLHNINIVSYFPLRGTSYIKLPVELRNPMKSLVNSKNEDNRCFL